ncbi:SDR family oxidoreductase [Prescottella agglutinans]|uniref:SDR family oxidoreductase n=1 Tax=Prescottella agglutinans TaxID=1644129 RepID=A0A438B908_9NOCA|nr:SDR family oxidoreductase [Prescottella agglutinans]RVW07460.1 SDR family oxidoreductase [Prescottella agglutinans]
MGAELSGSVAVVTGAAHGLGFALGRELLGRGCRVVLADRDEDGVRAAGETLRGEHGDRVRWVAGDASDARDIERSVALAESAFGPVDLYVANAGVFQGFGLDASEEQWATSWEVNVQAHVRAARLLVPSWLERGGGRFVAIASAAGLLTQLGSPTYSVTKHATVGFAEWLAVTYGDLGVSVTCVCPMGIATAMIGDAAESSDRQMRSAAATITRAGDVMTAEEVARQAIDGVARDQFLVLPHAEVADFRARKSADIDRWISGMQRHRRATDAAVD